MNIRVEKLSPSMNRKSKTVSS